MSVAVASWTHELVPGTPFEYIVEQDLRITNAALGDVLADPRGRSVVTVLIESPEDSDSEDDEEEQGESGPKKAALCSLRAGVFEQAKLNITFVAGQALTWTVTGKNSVFLLGNFIDTPDMPPFDDYDEQEERDFGLDSDLDLEASDDDEAEEEPKSSNPKKRRRESDADADELETPDLSKLSKNAKRKLAKKLKGEDGEAVPVSPAKSGDEKAKSKAKKDEATPKKDAATPKKDAATPKNDDKKEKKEKKEKSAGETRTLSGGLIVEDTTPGTGPGARKGQRLQMRYIGKFTNGKVFDKSVSGPAFAFRLGRGEVIKGWDEGLVGMKVGGERRLTIPGHLAYGSRPPKGIPANATLVFEVKLLGMS